VTEAIRTATTPEDFHAFAALVTEYVEWFRVRYCDNSWFADQVFGFQSLATELETLATTYSPPNGRTLVAVADGEIGGAVAYRKLIDGTCEMKRLFVSDRFKGRGLGRRLCEAIISSARADGFHLMRLDTGNLLTEAVAMYESLGFYRCEPHRVYPPDLMRDMVFMELPIFADSDRAKG
jgi:ribosomal protein S18 acetylase RimI-like enzyme